MITATIVVKGSPKSGHWKHAGVKGQLGGSAPKSAMSQAETDIRKMVDQFATLGSKRSDLAYNNYYDVVKQHGKFYDSDARIPLPKGVPKGKSKQCYRNSFDAVMASDYIYTEGLVFLEKIPIPIEHAWLTTKDGKVIDPTLPADDKAHYFGVQFNTDFVLDRAVETSYAGGILANDYMVKDSIIEHGLPEGALYQETVEKGSSKSGFYKKSGHKGRPGLIGGSAKGSIALQPDSLYYQKTHSKNVYGPFGENELKYENAYYAMFQQNIHSPVVIAGIIQKYDNLNKQITGGERYAPDTEGLIYVGRDPAYSLEDLGFKYGTPEYQEYWSNKDTSPLYINSEQLNYVMDMMGDKAQERKQFLYDNIPLPGTYQELFEDLDPTSTHAYDVKFGTKEYDQFQKVADSVVGKLKEVDITEFGRGEIEDSLFDPYIKEVEAQFGADSEQAKNVSSWMYRLGNEAKDYHEFEILKSVCTGDLDPEKGAMLGVWSAKSPYGNARYEELPTELWHAGTDADSIATNGIKSRRELGGRISEVGLGGGDDNTISFTSDSKIGADIERSLHEAHMVATGQLTVRKMLEVARDGAGGVGKNWAADLVEMKEPKFFEYNKDIDRNDYDPFRDGMPGRLQDMIDMEEGKKSVTTYVHGMGDRGEILSTTLLNEQAREKVLDNAFEYFKYDYSTIRQSRGGFMDPLFFGTNWKQLAKRDPKKFKSLKYKPKTLRSRGYRVSALGEWRVIGGGSVELVEVVDNYKAGDEARILGYIQ